MRLRDLLHNLLHRHAHAGLLGVGEIRLCQHRLTKRWHVLVVPDDDGAPICLTRLSKTSFGRLVAAPTPAELRRRAEVLSA